MNPSTAGGRCRPTNSSTTRPSRNALTAGMLEMPNWRASPGFWSMSTLTSSTRPPASWTARSRMGASWRQGAHQAAQKSTTTGTSRERSSTSALNVSSLTST